LFNNQKQGDGLAALANNIVFVHSGRDLNLWLKLSGNLFSRLNPSAAPLMTFNSQLDFSLSPAASDFPSPDLACHAHGSAAIPILIFFYLGEFQLTPM
jgi:hypothetical protein